MLQNKIYFANESPQMLEAFKKAQNTFKYFWRELYWERRKIVPGLDVAYVKAIFSDQENPADTPSIEYMWIDGVDFDGIRVSGILINKPKSLTNIKQGDLVEIPLDLIVDWIFSRDKVYGGFTIQVLRSEMNKKERKEHDEAWGMNFGNPDEILFAYEQEEHLENLIEHPMCINMKKNFEEYLKQNPESLKSKDKLGYALLHRETIAGNKTLVELLLQMGADINAKTNEGYTALDFAQKLEWEHIIPILKN